MEPVYDVISNVPPRDYVSSVIEFLNMLGSFREGEIKSLALVALMDTPSAHDVVSVWKATPFTLAAASSVLAMRGTEAYLSANGGLLSAWEPMDDEDYEDEDEEYEEDDFDWEEEIGAPDVEEAEDTPAEPS